MSFLIQGLPAADFADWFDLNDVQLASRNAVRRIADAKPGFPCRVSLTDAEVGEAVLLINYEHLAVESPYRAAHAIYIRAGEQSFHALDRVPEMLASRLLSVRGFDAQGMMTKADVVEGTALSAMISAFFEDANTQYLHIHFARPGCYAARVDRA